MELPHHHEKMRTNYEQAEIPSSRDVIENTILLNRPVNINIVSLNDDSKKYIQDTKYKPHKLTEVKSMEKLDQDW